jgi:hypothetical protein
MQSVARARQLCRTDDAAERVRGTDRNARGARRLAIDRGTGAAGRSHSAESNDCRAQASKRQRCRRMRLPSLRSAGFHHSAECRGALQRLRPTRSLCHAVRRVPPSKLLHMLGGGRRASSSASDSATGTVAAGSSAMRCLSHSVQSDQFARSLALRHPLTTDGELHTTRALLRQPVFLRRWFCSCMGDTGAARSDGTPRGSRTAAHRQLLHNVWRYTFGLNKKE